MWHLKGSLPASAPLLVLDGALFHATEQPSRAPISLMLRDIYNQDFPHLTSWGSFAYNGYKFSHF